MKKIGLSTLLLVAGAIVASGCTSAEPVLMPSVPYYIPTSGETETGGMYRSDGKRITIGHAIEIVEGYLRQRNDPNLEIKEILEFENYFYVETLEKDTGIRLFTALINPYNGFLSPQPHPDEVWNTRYKTTLEMMWGSPSPSIAPMTITEREAKEYARALITSTLSEADVGEALPFYGYYTVRVILDGKIHGLVNVNGYTGQSCYQYCHGQFVDVKELN